MEIEYIECLNCEIELTTDDLIYGNYCPQCKRSDLAGYIIEVDE